MFADQDGLENLQPEAYKSLYEISRIILQTHDVAATLRQIVRLARPVFIFDNIVLYELKQHQTLIPTYARSIGRGRSMEADMAWGETIAQEVVQTTKMVVNRQVSGFQKDGKVVNRLDMRDYLGLPLRLDSDIAGALIFIRFGGPAYKSEQIHLARLIAEHVEQLLNRQRLVERVAALNAARQFDRLQEQFVSTVTHDLRSPLGFIKGYATTLLREDADWSAEDRRDFLIIINEEADRLSAMVDNLLDSSRLQSGTLPMDFQPVHLAEVLQDFVKRIQAGDYGLNVQLDIDHSPHTILADSARLVQVMDNLITNAAKYAPESTIYISLIWESDKAHIIVRDTGSGIPTEHLEDIFKRLYRLPEHRKTAKGTGLGLFICREIVQAHGGDIYAESTSGDGATFHICLPIKAVPEQ
ncbi:MAG: ATP-binding protein [Chloroflexota bacterium]|nr:ATP-binding protein [Chloroflexota bacterium]